MANRKYTVAHNIKPYTSDIAQICIRAFSREFTVDYCRYNGNMVLTPESYSHFILAYGTFEEWLKRRLEADK